MKQSLCLFTIIAFVSFTSAQNNLGDLTTNLRAKHEATNFRTTTEATNDIPVLNPDEVNANSTTIKPTTVAPITTEVPTTEAPTTLIPTTTKPFTTTNTPSNNVTTTASPVPTPSKRSYDSFSFFGGLLVGIIIAVAGLFAFKFYKNRDPSYQNL